MTAPAWATPEPGDVVHVRLYRRRGTAACVRVKDDEPWTSLNIAPAPGLFEQLAAALPFRPRCVDVQITHGYPEPTAQLLDGRPLTPHEVRAVLQPLVYASLRYMNVQNPPEPENGAQAAASDNVGLS